MKKTGLLLALMLGSTARLAAQVTVDVTLDQDEFLPGEAVPAAVRITNRSGQTLHLGADSDWLTFSVESRDNYVVLKTGDVPVTGQFALDSSMRAIKRVDLAPYFNMIKPGRYTVIANVTLKDWNRQITSPPAHFDIIEGIKLWEQEIGIPRAGATNSAPPELRKYTLQEANYLRHSLMLYVRITDGSGKLNKVFPIGPLLSFGQPEPNVDQASNLHVLYQNGPRSFDYTIINPNGDIIGRQTYDYTTRPHLVPDRDGRFKVEGGRRRVTSNDLPPAKVASSDAPPPAP